MTKNVKAFITKLGLQGSLECSFFRFKCSVGQSFSIIYLSTLLPFPSHEKVVFFCNCISTVIYRTTGTYRINLKVH